jgi:DNA-directed RNA polymerase specialized sigma24 family protein
MPSGQCGGMGRPKDADSQKSRRARALQRLPAAYATALRLRDVGVSPERIAQQLGIEPEGVDALLDIAETKLTTILDATDDDV